MSAGLFLFVLSYHLGAVNARAQSGLDLSSVDELCFNVAVGRTVLSIDRHGERFMATVPRGSTLVAIGAAPSARFTFVGPENGDFCEQEPDGWALNGNVFGPTPTTNETWAAQR